MPCRPSGQVWRKINPVPPKSVKKYGEPRDFNILKSRGSPPQYPVFLRFCAELGSFDLHNTEDITTGHNRKFEGNFLFPLAFPEKEVYDDSYRLNDPIFGRLIFYPPGPSHTSHFSLIESPWGDGCDDPQGRKTERGRPLVGWGDPAGRAGCMLWPWGAGRLSFFCAGRRQR